MCDSLVTLVRHNDIINVLFLLANDKPTMPLTLLCSPYTPVSLGQDSLHVCTTLLLPHNARRGEGRHNIDSNKNVYLLYAYY